MTFFTYKFSDGRAGCTRELGYDLHYDSINCLKVISITSQNSQVFVHFLKMFKCLIINFYISVKLLNGNCVSLPELNSVNPNPAIHLVLLLLLLL
jgi:hypothetical protein